MCGAGVPVSALTGNCQNATTGESGTTYKLCEDFEGATSCAANYTSNCRVTWTIGRDQADPKLINFQSAGIGIGGSYAVFFDASDGGGTDGPYIYYDTASATDEQHVFYRMAFSGTDPGGARSITEIKSGSTFRAGFYINSSEKLYTQCGGNAATQTSAILASGTTYNVWAGYITGDTSTCYVCFTGTGTTTRPDYTSDTTNCSYTSSGTNTGTSNRVSMPVGFHSNPDLKYDHIRVKASEMTGVPD